MLYFLTYEAATILKIKTRRKLFSPGFPINQKLTKLLHYFSMPCSFNFCRIIEFRNASYLAEAESILASKS